MTGAIKIYLTLFLILLSLFSFSENKKRVETRINLENVISGITISNLTDIHGNSVKITVQDSYVKLYPYQKSNILNSLITRTISKHIIEYIQSNYGIISHEQLSNKLKENIKLYNYFENFESVSGIFFLEFKLNVSINYSNGYCDNLSFDLK